MKKPLLALASAFTLLLGLSLAVSANGFGVAPWTYSHGANSGEGVFGDPPVTSKCSVAGLTLIKSGPTSDDSAAGATITGVTGIALTELGFDLLAGGVYEDGPRFNVHTTDEAPGTYHAYNITFSATAVEGAPAGYQRYRMDLTKSGVDETSTGGKAVETINVVFDNHGEVTLKNFDINGSLLNCVPTAVATATPSASATAHPTASPAPSTVTLAQTGGGIPGWPFAVLFGLVLVSVGMLMTRRRI